MYLLTLEEKQLWPLKEGWFKAVWFSPKEDGHKWCCEELGELRPSSAGWGSQCQELLLLLWWKRQRQKACKAQFSGESPAVSREGNKVRHKTKQQFLFPTYLHTIVLHTAEPVQRKIMLRFLKGFCKTKNIGSHFLFRLVTSHTIMKSRS